MHKKTNTDPLDTPVMRQYLDIKKKYPHAILLFRMGDFYELFLEDAQIAAPVMEVALTKRQKEVPMAGVPYHSIDIYVSRLLEAGHHVAIAEQELDPNNPHLMGRRVRRVITPGTVIEERLLNTLSHNYMMAFIHNHNAYGIALADVSTGSFFSFCLQKKIADHRELLQVLQDHYVKFSPSEILVPTELYNELGKIPGQKKLVVIESWKASPTEGRRQIEHLYKQKIEGLGYKKEWDLSLGAVSLILHYVQQNFPTDFSEKRNTLQAPIFRRMEESFMQLDESSIRSLDIIENQKEKDNKRTLLGVLDICKTIVGKRLLRENLLLPLLDIKEIQRRQTITNHFFINTELRKSLREKLKGVADLERIVSRIGANRGNPRDLISILSTIQISQDIQISIHPKKELMNSGTKEQMLFSFQISEELLSLARSIEREVEEDAPNILQGKGREGNTPFLRHGVDERLDMARKASKEGGQWIIDFEKKERERLGMKSLRVKYNKIHGYFIEITRAQAKEIPKDYYRRQTLVGYERFSNEKLSKLETTIGEAQVIIQKIEQEKYQEFCQKVIATKNFIKDLMKRLAYLDFYLTLSTIAFQKKWTMPTLLEEARIEIKDGYHPIVEHYLDVGEQFTANDFKVNGESNYLGIVTGPNMAGKSTYIRQIALIQLLAQMGSFVPAKKAILGVRDRIFTRIGAGDNLTRGESTFFVEMLETAQILNQSTSRSLVIMDEVGRGTSTYDGLSLAWGIVEFLSDPDGATPLTLFATHYHELTELAMRSGVFNLTMEVHEIDSEVIFSHRVKAGVADRSYGIHVARLAGLPEKLIDRAKVKLAELEKKTAQQQVNTPLSFQKKSFPKKTIQNSQAKSNFDQNSLFS